jgi:hypothetical protein
MGREPVSGSVGSSEKENREVEEPERFCQDMVHK